MVKQQISNLRSGVRFSYPAPYIIRKCRRNGMAGDCKSSDLVTVGSIPTTSTKLLGPIVYRLVYRPVTPVRRVRFPFGPPECHASQGSHSPC